MKKLFFSILILLFTKSMFALQLSPATEISIMTCAAGNEIYSLFGHSAIRVSDPANNIDFIYNYGTFDFDTPGFEKNFIKGNLIYQLSKTNYSRFLQHYIEENRYIHEQILDLNLEEKQAIFDALETNYLPENKNYNYDFFVDNCATRIHCKLDTVLNHRINYSQTIDQPLSFRELMNINLENLPWTKFGLNFLLGIQGEKIPTIIQYMFLPDFLEKYFQKATLTTKEGNIQLVKEKVLVFVPQTQTIIRKYYKEPIFVFFALLLIISSISLMNYKTKKLCKLLDFSLFSLIGFVGIVLITIWLGTNHRLIAQNLNVIWAFPLHFFFAFYILFGKKTIIHAYFKFSLVLTALFLISIPFLPQVFPFAIIPVVFVILIRSVTNLLIMRHIQRNN